MKVKKILHKGGYKLITLENIDMETLRKYINRAFWRMQYKARKQKNSE